MISMLWLTITTVTSCITTAQESLGRHTLLANIGDSNDLAIDIAIDPTTNQPGISYVDANSNS